MTTRTTLRRTAAALAVAGVTAGAVALAAGTASAATTDTATVSPCTSNQFTTQLVYGGAGAGNRYAGIQLTANPGERCYLPGNLTVNLTGADNVLLNNTAPADAPPVALTDGSSAYIPLHWTSVEPSDEQQSPVAISVDAPNQYNAHGDYINPTVDLPWNLGYVDASAANHTIDVGAVTAGPAPSV
jgi:uncharacterized protein DUF4232